MAMKQQSDKSQHTEEGEGEEDVKSLGLRTSENGLRKKKEQGRNLNSKDKCKSQIWWLSVTIEVFPREK